MNNLRLLPIRFDVRKLYIELARKAHLWNQNPERTRSPDSPHREVDDIWVRYNKKENLGPHFADEHDSVWYPAYYELPQARDIVFGLMAMVEGERLGGVLITRIPPGKTCYPHKDSGWHAEYYDKYAVQIASAPGQSFNFEGERLDAHPGEVYYFNNAYEHWVENPTEHERITMIVCIRSDRKVG